MIKIVKDGFQNLLFRRTIGPFRRQRRWLEQTQWLPEIELKKIQLELLKKILIHCETTVPFYQDIFRNAAFSPESMDQLENISQLPVLTKKDILQAGSKALSNQYYRWALRKAHTGGTTGTPLNIYRSFFSIGHEHAFVRRQFDWAGVDLNDRVAYLTGRVIFPPDQTHGKLYAYDPFMKELILSTYHLTEQSAKNYLKAMQQFAVRAIIGYPSAVSFLAKVCLDSGKTFRLKAALTSSESLTESMRTTITQAFLCPVYDFYGSAERVCYIFTCEKGTYHVQPEYGYTEFIPIGNTGECKVVSTGFWNRAMPFIRYELGDTIMLSGQPCPCGRAFPTIRSISGRKADVIKTASGREYGAAILTHLLYGVDHIFESQIVQDQIDHLYIDYVPSEGFTSKDLQAFQELIKFHLPSELTVEFRKVQGIPRTTSGKIRPIRSLLGG